MSRNPLKTQPLKIWLAVLWLLFTLAMVLWWWRLGLVELTNSNSTAVPSRYRMMVSEGIFFFLASLAGGVSLIIMLIKDHQRQMQVKVFFATFSHDLKTSMARLRLQSDVLREKSALKNDTALERLANDINRLDLQLENSLIFSQEAQTLFVEECIPLSQIIESLRTEWEALEISLEKEVWIKADRRAISSIFKNLIQNAVTHGHAEKISIQPKLISTGRIQIQVSDDGRGYHGDINKLGKSPMPWIQGSGNGIGLFLCRSLLNRQNGDIYFENLTSEKNGFIVQILIPGDLNKPGLQS
ncbi:MAG: HAMP domain-containing sensor histidine kinase [Pseudobdellovibrio sp.]